MHSSALRCVEESLQLAIIIAGLLSFHGRAPVRCSSTLYVESTRPSLHHTSATHTRPSCAYASPHRSSSSDVVPFTLSSSLVFVHTLLRVEDIVSPAASRSAARRLGSLVRQCTRLRVRVVLIRALTHASIQSAHGVRVHTMKQL